MDECKPLPIIFPLKVIMSALLMVAMAQNTRPMVSLGAVAAPFPVLPVA